MNPGKIVMAAMAAGTAVSALGAYQQGKNAEKLSQYNAQVARDNADIAQQKAELDKADLKRRYDILTGEVQTVSAKSGVELQFDIVDDNDISYERNYAMIQYNTELEKRGYKIEEQTQLYTGRVAKQAGKMKAVGTLLTGGSEAVRTGDALGAFS
tara:strand:+ start:1261 stop:1725 length:465 start_codon:yes stop_codon:yes gene_type:complete